MQKLTKKENSIVIKKEEAQNVNYIFPKSEEIVIHKSDLQIQLEKFKLSIESAFNVFDLLAIISLWSPLYAASFNEIFGLTSSEIRSGYFVFAVLTTLFIVWKRVANKFNRNEISGDPSEMAEEILKKCQSNPKT